MAPLFTPTAVAVTAATMAITAPDPALMGTLAPAVAEVIVDFPDPALSASLEPDVSDVIITAPDPSIIGIDTFLSIPVAGIVFDFPDPAFVGPTFLTVDAPIGLNWTAPDPAISYGFVTNEDDFSVPAVPLASSREDLHRFQISALTNQNARGKLAATGKCTLIADVDATFLQDSRLGPKSSVLFDPLTANALTEKLAGNPFCPEENRKEGQWLLTHVNDAADDRSFRYLIIG